MSKGRIGAWHNVEVSRRSDRRPCTDDPAGKRGNQRPTKSPFFEAAYQDSASGRLRCPHPLIPRDDIRESGLVET